MMPDLSCWIEGLAHVMSSQIARVSSPVVRNESRQIVDWIEIKQMLQKIWYQSGYMENFSCLLDTPTAHDHISL
jgi:hypothetical protein